MGISRIVHVSTVFSSGSMTGVGRKLSQQVESFARNGIDMYVLNRECSGNIGGINYIKIGKISRLGEILIRFFKYYYICKYVDLKKYEKVIIRYTFMDLSFFYLMHSFSGEIYTEHHTHELKELMEKRAFYPLKILQMFLEKSMVRICSNRISGVVGVSPSIAESARNRFGKQEGYVFSNGISMQSYENLNIYSRVKTKSLNIVFCASSFKNWHGLDRVLSGAKSYDGSTKIVLNLAGEINSEMEEGISEVNNSNSKFQIKYHGILKWRDLLSLTQMMDLGVDSLGLHRLGISSGSTLKSKEYAALGVPFIYSSEDVDFKNISGLLYKVPSDNSPLDFENLVFWFQRLDYEPVSKHLQLYARDHLTWDRKVGGLVQWLYK